MSYNMSIFLRAFVICAIWWVTSCVSVDLKKPEVIKAEGVKLLAPKAPFIEFEADHLDRAWRNPNNGNSISYLSDCNASNDPHFKTIRDGIVSGVSELDYKSNEYIDYNQRRALHSLAEGYVDGVKTKFEILILKKNNCIYVLTHVGLTDSFAVNSDDFQKFLKGFRAP